MEKLFHQNKLAALAHILSFVGLLLVYAYYKNSHSHAKAVLFRSALPKYSDLSTTCNSEGQSIDQAAGQCLTTPILGVPKRLKWGRFNIIYGCAAFFAITAFAHIFYATDGFHKGSYSRVIQNGWNPYRWVEYGLSASLMSVLIGYTLGVSEPSQLANFALITAGMQASGFVVEASIKYNILRINREVVIGATFAGWILFIALWGPLIYSFWSRVNDVNLNYSGQVDQASGKKIKIPTWIWFIVLVQLANYAWFGIIQARQIMKVLKGVTPDFKSIESSYLKLSYAGKLGLASGIAYGIIYRTKDCT